MSEQSSNDPFQDCELGPDAILGTQVFGDVLFIGGYEDRSEIVYGAER